MPEHKFSVEMNCGGCSKAVNAVLTKTAGVSNVQIDMDKQLVTVTGDASQETLLSAIQKTGKKCSVYQG